MVGRVISTKMINTAVVLIETKKKHPLYGKTYLNTKKFLADDKFGVSNGDIVVIEKVKPVSKNKHWAITKVLGKDIVSLEQAELQLEAEEAVAEVMPEDKDKTEAEEVKEAAGEPKLEKKSKTKGGKKS
jgi:small subunit ribosomal protein S17